MSLMEKSRELFKLLNLETGNQIEGAVSLTATDLPTGWSVAQSDGPSLLVKQPPGDFLV